MRGDKPNNPDAAALGQPANVTGGNGATVPAQAASQELIPVAVRDAQAGKRSSPDPKALLSAFRRRWFLALALGMGGGVLAAVAASFLVKTPYVAFAELSINSVQEKILFNTAEEQTRFTTYKQTQMRHVTSPFVLNAALRKPEIAKLSMVSEQEYPVHWLEENVDVSSPATEFLRISLSGERPRELAALVNAVADAYLEEVVNAEENRRAGRLRQLERINSDEEEKLQTKLIAKQRLAESLHTADSQTLSVRQQLAAEFQAQLRQQFTQVRFDLMKATIELAALESGTGSVESLEFPDPIIDARLQQQPEFQRVQQQIARKKEMMERYKKVVGEDHRELVAAATELADAETQLDDLRESLRPVVLAQLRSELAAEQQVSEAGLREKISLLQTEKDHLERQLEEQKLEEKKTGILSFELESLNKKIDHSETIAEDIATEIKRLEVELQSPSRIRLHRAAEVPHIRQTSRRYKLMGVAGVGVFAVIVGGVVWLEFLARRISSMNEVVDELSLRVVGALPLTPRWITNGSSGSSSARQSSRTAVWQSVMTESIDSTRTMLLRDASAEHLKVIMIASAIGGEGKTTLSCHLATSLGRAGRKAVLLDCDLRRPSVHKVFDMELTPGLCEVLRNEASLDDAIRETPTDGLSIIASGKLNPRVLQMLALDGAETVFEQLKQRFDLVLVDSSPVLAVTDSLLIAQYVDAVIFSIRRDVSRVAKVAAACQRLSMLGVPVLGSIVIGLDDDSYGFRYPYRYGYGDYGARPAYYAQPQTR